MSDRIFCSYDVETPTVWRLEADFTVDTMMGPLTVPKGFIWDGASVPRFFWRIVPVWGMWSRAALVHDWLYDQQPFPRYKADAVFFGVMILDEVRRWRAILMWACVRLFGGIAWQSRVRARVVQPD